MEWFTWQEMRKFVSGRSRDKENVNTTIDKEVMTAMRKIVKSAEKAGDRLLLNELIESLLRAGLENQKNKK